MHAVLGKYGMNVLAVIMLLGFVTIECLAITSGAQWGLSPVEWSRIFLALAALIGAFKIAEAIQGSRGTTIELEKMRSLIDLQNSCAHGITVLVESANAKQQSDVGIDGEALQFKSILERIISQIVLPGLEDCVQNKELKPRKLEH